MCIAIGPLYRVKKGAVASLWGHLACSPLRLFGFGALLQIIALSVILLFSNTTNSGELATTVTLGIASLLLLGLLMERFPVWSERSPVIYLVYASSSFLITSGLFLIEASHFFVGYWFSSGVLLLVSGWLVGAGHLLDYRPWIPLQKRPRADLGLLAATGLGLGTALSLI